MPLARRDFLLAAGVAVAGASAARAQGTPSAPIPYDAMSPGAKPAPAPRAAASQAPGPPAAAPAVAAPTVASPSEVDWNAVRANWRTAPDQVNMSAMLIAAHPAPVRAAIEQFRRELDWRPVTYLEDNNRRLQGHSRAAAARYLGVSASQVALTDSTTMGAALVYSGLKLRPGDEILTTHQDYYVTHESLRHAAARNGAAIRRISLYDDIGAVAETPMVERVIGAIGPRTRVLALTWVHSSTGLKIPLPAITAAVARLNATRQEPERILVVVDGVHGFGNQDVDLPALGCDIFVAGCHKWLFGPRGTGVIAANAAGWAALRPTIPSFVASNAWGAWINNGPLPDGMDGALMSPGGFKAFEHLWALPAAVAFHEGVGRRNVADRTAFLADELKAGLAAAPGVRLVTPRSRDLSAGIVSFDVAGLSADEAVSRLRRAGVIASAAPYAVQHVRLTPSIMNTEAEVQTAIREVAALKA